MVCECRSGAIGLAEAIKIIARSQQCCRPLVRPSSQKNEAVKIIPLQLGEGVARGYIMAKLLLIDSFT